MENHNALLRDTGDLYIIYKLKIHIVKMSIPSNIDSMQSQPTPAMLHVCVCET